ncbi:aminotransferase class V-fold PLP-dependent enzyme [Chitinophaga horti]|uniref:cysteine desulfurase n=1 Tax=Chitinophaga horti TaxID=2920382 RepID=A0ABY6J4G4_9BACT|nr:aminotransferase class V-fold PLP-dependent enzyme [Chitinophaga horti]UYQ93206.1 aminotransferase class V-fold PLP-dependent enzyme [Chitinophaga horti]
MLKLPVYLDYNATTPCDPRVVEAMLPFFTEHFGNAASRSHAPGLYAHAAVDLAREQVAGLIGAEPQEVHFTSGATEANNLALKGVAEAYASKGRHIITCVTEHKAVLDACQHLAHTGHDITYLPVNQEGAIDLAALEAAIRPDTILISLMYANNETGVVHPVDAISKIARKHGVLFMCDASQAVGKIPVNVNTDGIDILTCSAHKLYGPKGMGAIYLRRKSPRVRVIAQIDGGGHERGVRSGTLNVPGIVGFGKACELAAHQLNTENIVQLRDQLESGLLDIPGTNVNGLPFAAAGTPTPGQPASPGKRLPHVTNISFAGVTGEAIMMATGKSIAVSSGSACTSASREPSYVLKAMGVPDELSHGSLRFSLGRFTTEEEIQFAVSAIRTAVAQLRSLQPFSSI